NRVCGRSHARTTRSAKCGQLSDALPAAWAVQLRTPTISLSGSFRSWATFRTASPASKNPVHCTATSGRAPPSISPAATPTASPPRVTRTGASFDPRSEEHTSELQSRGHLVCRLLLEKKKCRHPIKRHALDYQTL